MDGRPRPPDYARHSWSGFSTGEWEGDTLVQTATHLKEAYIRRWGPMRSDQATVRIRWKRIGDYLRATVIIYDPVYLDAPYIRTSLFWVHDPDLVMPPYPCEEATETVVERGTVPHSLPGKSLLPAQNPKRHRSVRHAVRSAAWRRRNDVSRVHREDEDVPAPGGHRAGGDRGAPAMSARQHGSMAARHSIVWMLAAAGIGVLGSAERVSTQDAWAWKPAIPTGNDGQVHVLPVRGNVYMLVGGGRQHHRAGG